MAEAATVEELSDGYANFMLSPVPGPGVCRTCFNLMGGYGRCYACAHGEGWLDAVVPISYSVAHEQLHHALWAYKRPLGAIARRFTLELAAVLWRHLARHERCLAGAAAAGRFDLVTTVPRGDRARDGDQPLRGIAGELVEPTRERYVRALERSPLTCAPRTFDPGRFVARVPLTGSRVLLVDDTWTSGASAQSAAAALKGAGASAVAAVVIGRHVNREWGENDRRLRALATPYDWSRCALCAASTSDAQDGAAPIELRRSPESPRPAAPTP